jgi:integrase
MSRPQAASRVNGPYSERGGTRFRLRIIDRGVKRDLYFPTERQAHAQLAILQQQLEQSAGRTVGWLIDEFCAERQRQGRAKPRTCAEQRERTRDFLHYYLEREVRAVTPALASSLYVDLVESTSDKTGKPLAAATHRFYLKLARALFAWAVRKGYVAHNPFQNVHPVGRMNVGKPQLRIDEAQRFVSTALQRFDEQCDALSMGALVALLMGLRASEVLQRRVRDVDRNGEILWIDSGKSKNARRYLDVPAVLQPRLWQLCTGREPDAFLLGSGRDGQARRRQALWSTVHHLCLAAQVPPVCTHSLRGLWATLGVQSGAVSHAVAASLGHGSFSMTAKHYAQPEAISGAHTARVMSMLSLDGSAGAECDSALVDRLRALPADVLRRLLADLDKTPAQ